MSVIELRQYTLHPGRRDVLIELLEREFVETHEAVGMSVLGLFRDLTDPDRFVWMRGFEDMEQRARALTAFYVEGEAWRTHRDAARATMVDTDNALLLRPAAGSPEEGVPQRPGPRPAAGSGIRHESRVVITQYDRSAGPDVLSNLDEVGARPLAWLETEPAENTFPALPVRTGEDLFVTIQVHDDAATAEKVRSELGTRRPEAREVLVLEPTERSLLY